MHVCMYACLYACLYVVRRSFSVTEDYENMFLSSIVPGEIMSGFEDRVRVWGVVFRG